MITKLPVVINNRIEYINFKIKKNASELHIELIDNIDTIKNNNFITIVCHNKYNCLYYFKISLPLNILIIDNNKLLSVFFFTLACNSQIRNKLDFFSVLIDNINSNKEIKGKKFSIIKLSDLSNYELHIWKDINLLNNNFNKIKKFNNVIDFLKKLYNYLYLYINLALFLIYLYPDYTNRSIKSVNNYTLIDNKVISLANIIKNIKFSYKYSNKFTIIEHINNISNDIKKISDIKVGKKYFLEINKNKWIKIDVQRLDNNIIFLNNDVSFDFDKYSIFYYPPTFINLIDRDSIFNKLSTCNLLQISAKKIFKQNNYSELITIFKEDNINNGNLLLLKDFDISFENIENRYKNIFTDCTYVNTINISEKLFLELIKKNNNFEEKIDFLKNLLTKYTFPVQYNKKKFDVNFERIIYFSLLNVTDFIVNLNGKIYLHPEIINIIPMKLKTLYFNILRIYYHFKESNSIYNIIYNSKIYDDCIHFQVIKVLLETDNLLKKKFLENEDLYNKMADTFSKNIYLRQIINKITWKNISDRLPYLDELFNNKELIIFERKLNRNIVPDNFDSRLKKIIINEFEMYKYLKKEIDFIKWTKFINRRVVNLYNETISISSNDYKRLGRLLYLLVNIEKQDLKNKSYLSFLRACKNNNKLILYKNRINLKIKQYFYFIKTQINLGYLAKHLTWNKTSKIILTDDSDNIESEEIKNLNKKLKVTTKKYYKYKGKYLKLKSDTSSLETELSRP